MATSHRSGAAILGLAAAALFGIAPSALGGIVGNPLTVTAYGDGGVQASWTLKANMGGWNGSDWSYDSSTPINLWSGSTLVGSLNNLHMEVFSDPQVILNFTAQANSSTTTFVFTSGLVTFGALVNPTAQASAGVTVTDNNGNGASFTGLQSDSRAYWANYNGTAPAGTNYATFFPAVSATALQGSNSMSDNLGPTPIAGSVSSMSAQFNFSVSAFDAATGTSNFQIVPTPGALVLLSMGGMAAVRRRR
jgi:hypothetical protein